MNDRWIRRLADGTELSRWQVKERDRVSRLFRSHVDTPYNRRTGRSCRIHREPCVLCVEEIGRKRWYANPCDVEAHHPDYSKPFLVAWLCERHHRVVDHGGVRLKKKHLYDYTSLIPVRPGLYAEQRQERADRAAVLERRAVNNDVPF